MKKMYSALTLIFTLFVLLSVVTAVNASSPVFIGLNQEYIVVQGELLTIPLEAMDPDGLAIDHFTHAPGNFGSIVNTTVNPTSYELRTSVNQVGTFPLEFTVYTTRNRATMQGVIIVLEANANELVSRVSLFSKLSVTFVGLRDSVQDAEAAVVDTCVAYLAAGNAGDSLAVENIKGQFSSLQNDFEQLNNDIVDLQTQNNALLNEVVALTSNPNRNILLNNINTLIELTYGLLDPLAIAIGQAENFCGINFNPAITTTSLPNAIENVEYSATLIAEDLDGDIVTFVFSDNILPAGIATTDVTGVISGTPEENTDGEYTITVHPVDSNGNAGEAVSLTLVVLAAETETGGNFPVVTTTSLPNAIEGVGYSAAITAEDLDAGDIVSFDFTGSFLPIGLSANEITGVISGAPQVNTAGGNYYIIVVPVDNNNNQGNSVTLPLVVSTQQALVPQYQEMLGEYEDLFDQYDDDLIDINDDIEHECSKYKIAIARHDNREADDAEGELDDIQDDDLEPLEDDVKMLEDNVEDLLDAVEDLQTSNAQSNLENDVEDLLDDISALRNRIETSFDDIDDFCSSSGTQAASSSTTGSAQSSTAAYTTVQTQPVQQTREIVSTMVTAPAFNQQQAKSPIVEEAKELSMLTLVMLSMVGLMVFLALLVFIFIMVK